MSYTDATLKKLFALSGNVCAFPGCPAPIVDDDSGIVVGEICHIKGKSPKGPRYDESQSDEERNGYDNLLLMCDPHNKIVDHKDTRDDYPPERLSQFKVDHEANFRRKLFDPTWAGDLNLSRVDQRQMMQFVNHFQYVGGSVITTHNQSGGQTAHQITNIYHEPEKKRLPSLVPIVESLMTHADNIAEIDFYDLRVRLHNNGEVTVREFRLEVEVPNAYANQTHSSMAEVRNHMRGDVTLYRHTNEHFPGFVLYSDSTSDHVLMLDYQIRHNQYEGVNESIKVILYAGDTRMSVTEYPIRASRNKDRMDQLGLT